MCYSTLRAKKIQLKSQRTIHINYEARRTLEVAFANP